ncbi:MAG: glycosyltransferase [Flavobacteriales bacterium]|nr:glycosyltransferase [Flavobacteriales bacterium]
MLETVPWLWFEWLVIGLYSFFLLFIFLYSLAQLDLVMRYRRRIGQQSLALGLDRPLVTVQLPIYNERYVAARLIDQVVVLDYPGDRLEIQVLDDSTDGTREIIEERVAHWSAKGVDVVHVRRSSREGFKAGALAHGLQLAKGELVAIFDADFLPDADFLLETVRHFQDPQVGVVQTRWGHLNADYSPLTAMQAFGLNAHFTVEQGGRNAGDCFINFNGTAGVWRKAAIVDAGGWSSDTLTEDLDLSYRAQLKGWKFVFREDVEASAELPAEMNALKTQQYRWTKGAAECAIKNLPAVLRSDRVTMRVKVHAFFHLMNSFIFISVFASAALSIPLMFVKQRHALDSFLLMGGMVFVASLFLLMAFYWTSVRRFEYSPSVGGFLIRFFSFLSLSMGMSLHNAVAVFEGYAGRRTPFVRTPKFSIVEREGSWIGSGYRARRVSKLVWGEVLLSSVFFWAAWKGVSIGDVGLLPFHLLLAVGFLAVGGLSLKHAFQG